MKKFEKISDIEHVISVERAKTYLSAYASEENDDVKQVKAYQLYLFNNKLNGMLLEVINWYEVALRNSLMRGIKFVYPHGIFENRFFTSLNDHAASSFISTLNSFLEADTEKYYIEKDSYNRKKPLFLDEELFSEGKIIADLKFVFWENLLTKSYINSIWKNNFKKVFPNMLAVDDIHKVYDTTKKIRNLRNRICHHEPNFNIDIKQFLNSVKQVFDFIDNDLYQVVDEEKIIQLVNSKITIEVIPDTSVETEQEIKKEE